MADDLASKLAYWRRNGAPGLTRSGPKERVVVDAASGEKTRHRPVVHDRTGERVGRHIDHADGRTDATVERFEVVPNPHYFNRKADG